MLWRVHVEERGFLFPRILEDALGNLFFASLLCMEYEEQNPNTCLLTAVHGSFARTTFAGSFFKANGKHPLDFPSDRGNVRVDAVSDDPVALDFLKVPQNGAVLL